MADHDQITDDCEPGIVLVRETDHGRFQQEVSSPNVIVGEGLGCGIYKGVCNRGKFPGPLTLACHYDGAGRISSARCGIWAPGMPRRSPKNS